MSSSPPLAHMRAPALDSAAPGVQEFWSHAPWGNFSKGKLDLSVHSLLVLPERLKEGAL